jgi:two-component system, NtrC family, nitrogen regulation sensor histidine kinase NtrY
MPSASRSWSLAGKLAFLGALPMAVAVGAGVALEAWLDAPLLAVALALLIAVPLWIWFAHRALRSSMALFRAMAGTVTSYNDGDFSFSLVWDGRDELGELVQAHNLLGTTLREQRLSLVQRELLLDTMVQHTPVAMVLVDARGHVVYGNLSARHLLHGGVRLEGVALADLLAAGPAPMRDAIARGGDGLFTIGGESDDDDEEIYHLARRGFRLNGRRHELFLIRHLTAELRRQEVRTWKKVIRVISHELNNSLGPVASLANSGRELVRRGQTEQIERAFATIEERARHLDEFIRGYARFAKLPAPRMENVPWRDFLARLRTQVEFTVEDAPPSEWSGRFDAAQLEQAVLNLVKNAHESGSAPEHVTVALRRLPDGFRLDVMDRGSGMSDATLARALVPFYSTKRTGTGLGLALSREIVEAHGGRIALANRDGGGLVVSLNLPA